jgi:hypothetical protein
MFNDDIHVGFLHYCSMVGVYVTSSHVPWGRYGRGQLSSVPCRWYTVLYLDADPERLEDVDGAVGLVLWKGQLEILEAVAPRGTSPRTELPTSIGYH